MLEIVPLSGVLRPEERDGTVEVYSRFAPRDNPLLHLLHEGFWLGTGTVRSCRARRRE